MNKMINKYSIYLINKIIDTIYYVYTVITAFSIV